MEFGKKKTDANHNTDMERSKEQPGFSIHNFKGRLLVGVHEITSTKIDGRLHFERSQLSKSSNIKPSNRGSHLGGMITFCISVAVQRH